MFVAYFCDAMLLVARARACTRTTYGGNYYMRGKDCARNATKCQFRHARSISTTLQWYISNMTVVLSIAVSTARSITVLRDNLKRIARLIFTARSVTNNSCEFPLFKNIPDAIGRHLSSSCFFSQYYIAIKNFARASGSN